MNQDDDADDAELPREPIDRLVEPLIRFLHVEAASGVVLLLAAVAAFALANSRLAGAFLAIWKTPVFFGVGDARIEYSLGYWVNDGLMAIFFFVVGLEVKRELAIGRLRDLREAALPIAAALGGMVVPALLYVALLGSNPAAHAWGIPMATDIAFVVGSMAVLGSRVPQGLRVLLLSLAIADDIGAILVIALVYASELNFVALLAGVAMIGLVLVLQRTGVRAVPVYVAVGTLAWFAFHESGIHATIAGVILGLLTPARGWVSRSRLAGIVERGRDVWQGGDEQLAHEQRKRLRRFQTAIRETLSPLERLEMAVHPWSAYLIMPIFALANAGVAFDATLLRDPIALGVGAGLVLGKPAGIVLFSIVAVWLGIARLPEDVSLRALLGGGCLAGIGFTMSLFIAGLALEGDALTAAKVGVLMASVVSGVVGMAILYVWGGSARQAPETAEA